MSMAVNKFGEGGFGSVGLDGDDNFDRSRSDETHHASRDIEVDDGAVVRAMAVTALGSKVVPYLEA